MFLLAVFFSGLILAMENGILPVSYTHLDVYKRQEFLSTSST